MSILYRKLIEIAKRSVEEKKTIDPFVLMVIKESTSFSLKMLPFDFASDEEKDRKIKALKSFIKSEYKKKDLEIIEFLFYTEAFASKFDLKKYSKEEIKEMIKSGKYGSRDVNRQDVIVISQETLDRGERRVMFTIENNKIINESHIPFISYEDAIKETSISKLGRFSYILNKTLKND